MTNTVTDTTTDPTTDLEPSSEPNLGPENGTEVSARTDEANRTLQDSALIDSPDSRTVDRVEAAPAASVVDTPPPEQPRRGTGLVGLIIGAALAVGAGYGVQRYVVPQPPFDPSALEARLTAAETEAQGLRAEIARLSEIAAAATAPEEATPAVPDQALLDRLAAVEARTTPDVEPLAARVDQLEANLAALANLPSETGVSPAALAALQAEVAALKSQKSSEPAELNAMIAAVETKLTEVEARAGDLTTQATAIATAATRTAALGQISAALDSGLPYRGALTQLGDAEMPEALTIHADTGLPTIATLKDSFPAEARAALEQALRADTDKTWSKRVAIFLRNQTGARSLTPRDGNDPDSVLSRAEAALAKADLTATLTELAALPPESLAALADWTAIAQQRLDAKSALAGLMQAAGQ